MNTNDIAGQSTAETHKRATERQPAAACSRWYVASRDHNLEKVRGPYCTSEAAAAVRDEMERNEDEHRNLWIVSENT